MHRRQSSVPILVLCAVLAQFGQAAQEKPSKPTPGVRALLKRAVTEPPETALRTFDEAQQLAQARQDAKALAEVAAAEARFGGAIVDRGDAAHAQPLLEQALRIQERDARLA